MKKYVGFDCDVVISYYENNHNKVVISGVNLVPS